MLFYVTAIGNEGNCNLFSFNLQGFVTVTSGPFY